MHSIDDKTGWSGRNVAMGIFFWPGVVVNQMNAGDAREAANERLKILSDLKSKKRCGYRSKTQFLLWRGAKNNMIPFKEVR